MPIDQSLVFPEFFCRCKTLQFKRILFTIFFIVGYKADSKGVTFSASLKKSRRGRSSCVWHFTFVSTNVPDAFIATMHRSGKKCDLCNTGKEYADHHLQHISPPKCRGGEKMLSCKCLILMFYLSWFNNFSF